MIRLAHTNDEIAACYQAMQALRTNLAEDSFVPLVRQLMREDGYKLAYLAQGHEVVCVAGFRISRNLVFGKNLYVEDLSTLEGEQSRGYGHQMMEWLRDHAVKNGCDVLHLHSGIQRTRAHKFYMNHDMTIVSYHFGKRVGTDPDRR